MQVIDKAKKLPAANAAFFAGVDLEFGEVDPAVGLIQRLQGQACVALGVEKFNDAYVGTDFLEADNDHNKGNRGCREDDGLLAG